MVCHKSDMSSPLEIETHFSTKAPDCMASKEQSLIMKPVGASSSLDLFSISLVQKYYAIRTHYWKGGPKLTHFRLNSVIANSICC